MSTLATVDCEDCGHTIRIRFGGYKSKIGRGDCSYCGLVCEISIVVLKKSPFSAEKLAERMNRHMG